MIVPEEPPTYSEKPAACMQVTAFVSYAAYESIWSCVEGSMHVMLPEAEPVYITGPPGSSPRHAAVKGPSKTAVTIGKKTWALVDSGVGGARAPSVKYEFTPAVKL